MKSVNSLLRQLVAALNRIALLTAPIRGRIFKAPPPLPVEPEKQAIEKIDKRIWQLILLAVVVILYLTLSLLGLQFFWFSGEREFVVFSPDAYKYSLFLATLILLFCSYMIVQQRKLLQLSRAFFSEREAASKLSQDVEVLEALLKVSSGINSQRRLSDILTTTTKEMLACFHADHSSIMLVDKSSGMLKTMASFGEGSEHARDALVPIGKSVSGWVVKNGKPLLLNGQVSPAEFPGTDMHHRAISSSLCVPLKRGNKTIGVLNVNLLDRERTFSKDELKLITIFANNVSVAINNAILLGERGQRIRFQTMLEQLHSPQVIRELVRKIQDWDQPQRMREKLEVTILFADIRGFSAIVNQVKLEEIMDFLDAFYTVMTKAVFGNDGSVNKFLGDEVMAFFGAPTTVNNSTARGVNTALEMVASFEELRAKFSERSPHFASLGIGIGVDTGEVFVGNVGSKSRYDYTVIGNAANIARRLCSYAEPDQILITEGALAKMNEGVGSEVVDTVILKGLPHSVTIYKITSLME
jgi:adenylate cyclase